jgi:hypothetical protein
MPYYAVSKSTLFETMKNMLFPSTHEPNTGNASNGNTKNHDNC